jgi:hypothetical protein
VERWFSIRKINIKYHPKRMKTDHMNTAIATQKGFKKIQYLFMIKKKKITD